MIPVGELMAASRSAPYFYKTWRYGSYGVVPHPLIAADATDVRRMATADIIVSGDRTEECNSPKDTSVLIDLLSAFERLLPQEEYSIERMAKVFLPVFQKYGMAFWADRPEDRRLGDRFSFGWFFSRLCTLYALYSMWVSSHFGEGIAATFKWLDVSPAELIEFTGTVDVSRRLKYEGKNLVIRIECKDLLDAVHAQMQDIIMQGEAGKNDATLGATVGYCSECGIPFIKRHGNASLCAYHSRNDVKVRSSRARKKGRIEEE